MLRLRSRPSPVLVCAGRRNFVNVQKYRCGSGRTSISNPHNMNLHKSITDLLLQCDVINVQYSNDVITIDTVNKCRLYTKYTPYLNQCNLNLYPGTKALRESFEESEGERLKKYARDIENDVIGCLYDYPECVVLVVGYNANMMTKFFIVQAPF